MSRKKGTTIMATGNDPAGIFAAIAFYLFGPLVWAAHLTLVYGPQSALCAFGNRTAAAERAADWTVLAVTAFCLALIAAGGLYPVLLAAVLRFRGVRDDETGFAVKVMRLLALLSLFGVAGAGLGPFLLDACAQLR